MDEISRAAHNLSRRQLLKRTSLGLGTLALTSLLDPSLLAAARSGATSSSAGELKAPHFAPKARRVI